MGLPIDIWACVLSPDLMDAIIGSFIGTIVGAIIGTLLTQHLTTVYTEKIEKNNRKRNALILLGIVILIKKRLDQIPDSPSLPYFKLAESPFFTNNETFLPFMPIFNSGLISKLNNFDYELRYLEEFRLKVKEKYNKDLSLSELNWDLISVTPHLKQAKFCADSLIVDLRKETD
ncbi:hypothetical protein [Methanoregula sp.]|uniref:hypothetical protein n=1 Tax=Methanoregula sp. TaxID=2052170 RepID=UPI003BAFAD43